MTENLDAGLVVELDDPLPDELAVGAGTVLFVCGVCFHRAAAIRRLYVILDGVRQPVDAQRMPRLDLFRSLHPALDPYATAGVAVDPQSPEDPHLHSYRSGFWSNVVFGPAPDGPRELVLEADLEGGGIARRRLAILPAPAQPEPVVAPPPSPPSSRDAGPLVAIAMAAYEPPPELFRDQIESIRAQTHGNWLCVISDDCSSEGRAQEMRAILGDDERFVISRAPRRLGFYENFHRALQLVPAEAAYVALADQDDRWYPDKLSTLLGAIGSARLVYSDARVVQEDGTVISDTYWVNRTHNHHRLASLLLTNSVTGAASLLDRSVLDYALPFPPPQFVNFHDHWIALVALALGDVEFVDRPLYDYVQHGQATIGHATANQMPRLSSRLPSLLVSPRQRVVHWRRHYFVDACRLQQWARIVWIRCAASMTEAKRRQLERFLNVERSVPALADLWRLGALELLGRGQTLGAEWMLAYAFTWRRLLNASVRERPVRALRLDAVPPEQFTLMPRRPPARRV
jgi:glycosyltransferase involved in cell wall biosynthesis